MFSELFRPLMGPNLTEEDAFIACGVNCCYPCEPAAGMDMVALKKKYGKRSASRAASTSTPSAGSQGHPG